MAMKFRAISDIIGSPIFETYWDKFQHPAVYTKRNALGGMFLVVGEYDFGFPGAQAYPLTRKVPMDILAITFNDSGGYIYSEAKFKGESNVWEACW